MYLQYVNKIYRSSLLLLSLFFLGCTSSSIIRTPIPGIDSATSHPASCATSHRCIRLSVSFDEEVRESLGTQFLLFVLPLGRTRSGDIQEVTFNTLYKELVLLGYSPVLGEDVARKLPSLEVVIQEISLTTYDLLVTRLVKTRLSLELHWQGSTLPPVEIHEERSSYLRLPFSKEVSREYQLTLVQAFQKGIKRLHHTFGHIHQRNVK